MKAKRVSSIYVHKRGYQSFYDGSLKGSTIIKWKSFLIKVFSLGLAYPWAMCMTYRAQCEHQSICGRRLKFIGDPKELAQHWVAWWALCIVTFGLYHHVVSLRMKQWVCANTVFEDTEIISREEIAQEVIDDWRVQHRERKQKRAERKQGAAAEDPDAPDDYIEMPEDYEELLEECEEYVREGENEDKAS